MLPSSGLPIVELNVCHWSMTPHTTPFVEGGRGGGSARKVIQSTTNQSIKHKPVTRNKLATQLVRYSFLIQITNYINQILPKLIKL